MDDEEDQFEFEGQNQYSGCFHQKDADSDKFSQSFEKSEDEQENVDDEEKDQINLNMFGIDTGAKQRG